MDKVGNIYYQHSRQIDGALTEKRWVEFKGDPDPTTLPVEWRSWLIGQRKLAPTSEEIMALEAHRKQVKLNAAKFEKEEEKRRFRSKSLLHDAGAEETKPPEMGRFIQQVAALEGVNSNGGQGDFANEVRTETTSIESSRSPESPNKSNSSEGESIQQDQQRVIRPKETKSAYEAWKWVPPN